MIEKAKWITIDNALCSRDGKERKSLSSRESFDESDSRQGCDLPKYVINLEIDWNGDIQIVRYKLVSHVYN
jgi:hypothetical protein